MTKRTSAAAAAQKPQAANATKPASRTSAQKKAQKNASPAAALNKSKPARAAAALPDNLESKPTCGWEHFADPKRTADIESLAANYVHFLTACKTERETIDYVVDRLKTAGFVQDFGSKACYRVKAGKTIFIARRGKRPLSEGFRFLGAHADTPRLDLKQHPLYEDAQLGLAKTHYYGGIRKHQWLARPLALHGVAVKKDGTQVRVVIGEDPADPVFSIADLLPHLAYKQVEQKLADAFDAERLNVIFGHAPAPQKADGATANGNAPGNGGKRIKRAVLEYLYAHYGLVEDDLFSAEMQIVPAGPARFVGLDRSIIGGFGHDDRACVFTALEALLAAKQPEHAQVVVFWDKEEIGSEGSTGAKSRFFEYCLEDLVDAWEPGARMSRVMESAKAISADVHGALDPDFQELHDKLNVALLGHGPCFSKYTGHRGKVGANDAHPEYVAWLRNLLDGAGVPWQMAGLGRVDLGGGGTVAKFLAEYGMDIIDFGPAVLSMHSPFELVSKIDLYATKLAYEAFLKS